MKTMRNKFNEESIVSRPFPGWWVTLTWRPMEEAIYLRTRTVRDPILDVVEQIARTSP